jgi:hypothetical protein
MLDYGADEVGAYSKSRDEYERFAMCWLVSVVGCFGVRQGTGGWFRSFDWPGEDEGTRGQ